MKIRRGKPAKGSPVNLLAMNQSEMQAFVLQVAEKIRNSRSLEDRRDIVLDLMDQGCRRSEIFQLLGPAFGCSLATIKEDMRIMRDWQLNWARNRDRSEVLLDVERTNQAIIRRGMRTGDFAAANTANRLRAAMHQLISEGIPSTGASDRKTPEQLRAEIGRKLAKIAGPQKEG